MSKQRPAAAKPKESPVSQKTIDSFRNLYAKMGLQTDNQAAGGTYGYNPITLQRTLLEWIHRGSWIGGVAVDVVGDDMTRAGVAQLGTVLPEDQEAIEDCVTRLNVWGELSDLVKWARLYGGAIGVILIEGQDLSKPLRLEAVGKGTFRGLWIVDRWNIDTSMNAGNVVQELGPDMGLPEYYTIQSDSPVLKGQRIHYTRVIRMDGVRLPYQQRNTNNGWGNSVYERLYDRLLAFDSTTQGAAQLVYKSYLRTVKMEGLRSAVAGSEQALNGIVQMIQMMSRFQSIEGITLLDTKDEFEAHQVSSFTGLSDLMLQFGQQLSGSVGVPLVRLFGQSPSGLNATGESDLRLYYDNILQQQNRYLYDGVSKVYRCAAASEGVKLDDSYKIKFNPLWQLSEDEKSTIAERDANTVRGLVTDGIYGPITALLDLRQNSAITNRFSNITDKVLSQAEEMAAPIPEEVEVAEVKAGAAEEVASEKEGGKPAEEKPPATP